MQRQRERTRHRTKIDFLQPDFICSGGRPKQTATALADLSLPRQTWLLKGLFAKETCGLITRRLGWPDNDPTFLLIFSLPLIQQLHLWKWSFPVCLGQLSVSFGSPLHTLFLWAPSWRVSICLSQSHSGLLNQRYQWLSVSPAVGCCTCLFSKILFRLLTSSKASPYDLTSSTWTIQGLIDNSKALRLLQMRPQTGTKSVQINSTRWIYF